MSGAMTRKHKRSQPTYRIESLQDGAWLWVILPPYRNKAEADSAALRMAERAGPSSSYRVVEDTP